MFVSSRVFLSLFYVKSIQMNISTVVWKVNFLSGSTRMNCKFDLLKVLYRRPKKSQYNLYYVFMKVK